MEQSKYNSLVRALFRGARRRRLEIASFEVEYGGNNGISLLTGGLLAAFGPDAAKHAHEFTASMLRAATGFKFETEASVTSDHLRKISKDMMTDGFSFEDKYNIDLFEPGWTEDSIEPGTEDSINLANADGSIQVNSINVDREDHPGFHMLTEIKDRLRYFNEGIDDMTRSDAALVAFVAGALLVHNFPISTDNIPVNPIMQTFADTLMRDNGYLALALLHDNISATKYYCLVIFLVLLSNFPALVDLHDRAITERTMRQIAEPIAHPAIQGPMQAAATQAAIQAPAIQGPMQAVPIQAGVPIQVGVPILPPQLAPPAIQAPPMQAAVPIQAGGPLAPPRLVVPPAPPQMLEQFQMTPEDQESAQNIRAVAYGTFKDLYEILKPKCCYTEQKDKYTGRTLWGVDKALAVTKSIFDYALAVYKQVKARNLPVFRHIALRKEVLFKDFEKYTEEVFDAAEDVNNYEFENRRKNDNQFAISAGIALNIVAYLAHFTTEPFYGSVHYDGQVFLTHLQVQTIIEQRLNDRNENPQPQPNENVDPVDTMMKVNEIIEKEELLQLKGLIGERMAQFDTKLKPTRTLTNNMKNRQTLLMSNEDAAQISLDGLFLALERIKGVHVPPIPEESIDLILTNIIVGYFTYGDLSIAMLDQEPNFSTCNRAGERRLQATCENDDHCKWVEDVAAGDNKCHQQTNLERFIKISGKPRLLEVFLGYIHQKLLIEKVNGELQRQA